MLIIPLDGPPIERHEVLVFTTAGQVRGIVTTETPSHVHLMVGGAERALDRDEILTIVSL